MSHRRPWSQEFRLGRSRRRNQVLKKGGARFNIGTVRALAALVLAPAFALGAVAGAAGIVGGKPAQVEQRPTSLIWANRVFVSQQDLAKWLESRGATYEAWAAQHPSTADHFESNVEKRLSAASSAPAQDHATATDRSKPLTAGLVAGIGLAALLALFALRDRLRPVARPYRPRRPARPAVTRRQLRPLTNAGQLSASIRRHGHSAVASVSPHLTALASSAGTRRARLLEDLRDPYIRRRIQHYLPRIAFYVLSAVCALVLGASVALYFQ
jgi:hypothetical protein